MQELDLASPYSYVLPSARDLQISRRESLQRNPDGSSSSISEGSQISFTIPASKQLLVGQSVYLSMRVKTSDPTHYFSGAAHRLIQRVRITNLDGVLLEDLDNYSTLHEGVLRTLFMSDDYENDMLAVSGVYPSYADAETVADYIRFKNDTDFSHHIEAVSSGPVITSVADGSVDTAKALVGTKVSDFKARDIKSTMAAGNGKLFILQLSGSGILGNELFYPLEYFRGIRLEITLAPASIALDVGTSYLVNQPKLYYVAVSPSERINASLSKAHQAGELTFMYDTFSSSSGTLTAQDTCAIDLSKAVLRANNVMVVKRQNSILTSGTNSFVFDCTSFGGSDGEASSQYYFEHNSIRMPVEPVASLERAYIETMSSIGQFGVLQSDLCKFKDYINGKFVISCNLKNLPEADEMSGVSLKAGKTVTFNLKLSAPDTSRLDLFVWYKSAITASPQRGVEVVY